MQGDGANMALVQMLVDLEQVGFAVIHSFERLMQWRQCRTVHHHDGAMYLGDLAYRIGHGLAKPRRKVR